VAVCFPDGQASAGVPYQLAHGYLPTSSNAADAASTTTTTTTMGVDLHRKVGGTKSENYWFEKSSFFKPSKTSKVQILGFLFFFICPAIYSANQT